MTSENENESKTVFVGPAQTPWWKFKIAGIIWSIIRGSNWVTRNVPIFKQLKIWSFKVRVMSRDFEVQDNENDD